MRIWFELTNSPHINMFAALISELKKEHEVIITCRPLANTIELLDLHKLDYKIVGQHYGGNIFAKIIGYPIRVFQLYKFILKEEIDIAISQCSYHSPVVARMCGAPSIYMTDNEYAIGNIPAFLFANTIMVPEYLDIGKLKKQFANAKKIIFYPGVKEGIYLWELQNRLPAKNNNKELKTVYIRPEPWTAHYYKGSRYFLDDLIIGMKDRVKVILLPRGKAQGTHYQDKKFNGIEVVSSALDIADIVPTCDLFIGAGGTMTREMAVLGIPTISVYQDELLDVDRHLLHAGTFLHRPNLTAQEALAFLELSSQKPPDQKLLEKGKSAYDLIKGTILNR